MRVYMTERYHTPKMDAVTKRATKSSIVLGFFREVHGYIDEHRQI